MMDHSHYHLQYELYLLALCRTLSGSRGEAVNWEEEIGGAAYLFVRGTRESDSRGVFTARPSLERMLTLASAMGLEGVVK
jgi:exodeoxyribonuclease V beta subunit